MNTRGNLNGGASPMKAWVDPTVYQSNLYSVTLPSRRSVTGSGWLLCFGTNVYVGSNTYIAVKIDGVFVIGDATHGVKVGDTDYNIAAIMLRYETSFEIFHTSASNMVAYLEGDVYEEAILHILSGGTLGSTSLIISVTGPGWLDSVFTSTNATGFTIVMDGGDDIDGVINPLGAIKLLSKFSSSLLVYAGVAMGVAYYN